MNAAQAGARPAHRRIFAAAVVVALALVIVLAAFLAPYPPDVTDLAAQLQPPSSAHILGTDFYGRDLLSRLLVGGQATLAVAAGAVALSATLGSLGGLLAGATQGWTAQAWVGLFDLMLAFPALGAGPLHILLRHLARNIARPVLALATVDLGRAIISVAALGYLGLGAAPPQAEWGLMLYEGRGYIASAPWASFVPGLAITAAVLAVTILGDAMSENAAG